MEARESWQMRRLYCISAFVLAVMMSVSAYGQNTPEANGFRFGPSGLKSLEMLAKKAGGPTERMEIQSTTDHIDYIVKTYVLKEANAAEVYELILRGVQLEGGHVDRVAPGSEVTCPARGDVEVKYEGESLLIVTMPEWMEPYIADAIKTLDRKGLQASAFGTGCKYINPRHRRPSELADLIRDSVASGFEVFVPDDSRNILYIEDCPSYMGGNLQALDLFDVPPTQIDVRVRIYEISDSHGHDIGLDWYAWKKAVQDGELTLSYDKIRGEEDAGYGVSPENLADIDIRELNAELSFSPLLATEFLNYLVGQGEAEVITDTRLSLINGEAGTVNATKAIPYVILGYMDGQVANSPLRDVPQAADDGAIREYREGILVELLPTIGTETIQLEIGASVLSHLGYTPNQSVPIVAESTVASNLIMEEGVPSVLGGLTRVTIVSERSGIPGLRSVAWLKYLFSREVKREEKSQIIVTVLPLESLPGEKADVGGMKSAMPDM